jgi:hypothetical protein
MGLLFPKEELMRWKEPSNYQQEKSSLTLNAALFLIGFNVIAIVVLLFTSLEEGKKAGFIIFAIFVGFFMTNITVGYYVGTSTVTLEEDGVGQRQGKYRGFSAYDDVETCTITRKKFPSASFFHLDFTFKDQKTFTFRESANDILLQDNVDLNSVLDIFRSKGIKIVEDYVK